MATPAQIAANQSNAQFSTGPSTSEGRERSAQNRLNLGFRSATVLLPSDDPAEYEALLEELTAHFETRDLTETRFVREMADAEWRLRRVRTCLASAIARQMEKLADEFPDLTDRESRAIETLAETGCSYATWLRYETKFERQYDRAHRGWSRYQEERRRVSDKEADIAMKNAIFGPMPTAKLTAKSDTPKPTASPEAPGQVTTAGLLIPTTSDPCGTTNGQLASNVQNVQIARNAPCPCKSGEKYKRCCGRTAVGQIHNLSPRSAGAVGSQWSGIINLGAAA